MRSLGKEEPDLFPLAVSAEPAVYATCLPLPLRLENRRVEANFHRAAIGPVDLATRDRLTAFFTPATTQAFD